MVSWFFKFSDTFSCIYMVYSMHFFRLSYRLNESVLLHITPCGPSTPIRKQLCPVHRIEPFKLWTEHDSKYNMLFEHHIFDPDLIGEIENHSICRYGPNHLSTPWQAICNSFGIVCGCVCRCVCPSHSLG